MRMCRSALASLLIGLMACLPLLGTDGGMLSPMAGTVKVNGQPALAGSAVVTGDLVTISPDGSARMTLRGASVIAAAKTVFRIERSSIQLRYGMVQIAGHVPVISNGRVVMPQSADGRYAVIALNGPMYVEALAGAVKVNAYGRAFTVPSGTAMKFQDTSTQTTTQTTTPDQTQQNQGAQPATPDQTQQQTAPATPDQTQQQQTAPATPDQTQQQQTAPATPDQTQQQQTPPATPDQTQQQTPPATQEQQPAAGTQQTTTEQQGGQTTTTTETTVSTEGAGAGGGGGLSVPLTIGLAAAAAVITGVVVHQATKCDNCVVSQSQ